MIAALIGFLAPFIPDVFSIVRQWIDHRQEVEILRLRGEQARDEATWRMEEIRTRADIAELQAIRRPHQSFGVQLLDKAAEGASVWRWSLNLVFLAFAALDWLISSVRPALTYWAFGLYTAVKLAKLSYVYDVTGDLSRTLLNEAAWTPFDQELLFLVVAFWFGQRTRQRALGAGQ